MSRSVGASDGGNGWTDPMSAAPTRDRGRLPPKKRDARPDAPQTPPPAATFKVPYPYKSQHAAKSHYALHPDLLQPLAAPATTLYQPWVQTHAATRSKPHAASPARSGQGWEWRDLYHRGAAALDPRWDLPPLHRGGLLAGHLGELSPSARPPEPRPRQPAVLSADWDWMGSGYRWEAPTTARGRVGPHAARPGGPYARRKGGRGGQSQSSLGASPAPFSPAYEDRCAPANAELTARPAEKYWTSGTSSPPPSLLHPSSSSSSDRAPWLLPHFAAGSLIELRDGRLRRVEDLRTEDFRLGAEARPELRLCRCTVQHISASSTSPSLSRLLILLHEESSQELVDVFVEYPFFVCGRGWSSCCPQRTASLCGLRCHQLSVGDVCLALTPAPPPPPATAWPQTPGRGVPADASLLPRPCAQPAPAPPPAPDRQITGQGGGGGGAEPVRRRRRSAPELPRPEAN